MLWRSERNLKLQRVTEKSVGNTWGKRRNFDLMRKGKGFPVLSRISLQIWVRKKKRPQPYQLSSVQFSHSVFATPWITACQASLSITISRSSLKFTSINGWIDHSPCHPLSPLLLQPPIPASNRVFSSESNLHMRWPKYWSFSFSIIPSKEHPGLISFRMDWLDLLAA